MIRAQKALSKYLFQARTIYFQRFRIGIYRTLLCVIRRRQVCWCPFENEITLSYNFSTTAIAAIYLLYLITENTVEVEVIVTI
jgi:hypothetical protein